MKKYIIAFITLFSLCFYLPAQVIDTTISTHTGHAIGIYLDCIKCDMEYFKENLTIVNYTRDAKEADVHIMVTSLQTGSGGMEFLMEFMGQNRFHNRNDTLKFTTSPELSSDELRQAIISKLKIGLVPFLMKTPYADKMIVIFDDINVSGLDKYIDPWRDWIFNIDLYGSASGEKHTSNYMLNMNFYVGKVTDDYKIETFASITYLETKFRYTVENSPQFVSFSLSNESETQIVESIVEISEVYRDISCYGLFVKSMGSHFGLGGFMSLESSLRSNLDLRVRIMPAIEYSLYDYNNASRRQLRFLYSVGYEYSDYADTTIYGKMMNRNFRQDLNIGYKVMDKNGSINASVYASTYVPDISKFNIGVRIRARRKVFSGFSVNANFALEMPRNQISIPAGNFDEVDILTGRREMQTNFRYAIGVGISFSFGSKNNNAVNPRFSF